MAYIVTFGVLTLGLHARIAHPQQLTEVTADQIPLDQQTYDFSAASRCRIFAHDSCIIQNENQHVLLIDGGFGTFQTKLNSEAVSVADLNPYTVAFDLLNDFATSPDLEPLWQHKKPHDANEKLSIVNHGGIWISRDNNTVWTQGGHFYHGDRWSNSSYFVPKEDIPEWRLWRMHLDQPDTGWQDVTQEVSGHLDANRTFAGAAASVPNSNKKFWLGGLFDSTTSPTTPNLTLQTTKQMLVFDESSNSVAKQEYYAPGATDGYWQGNLIHLPIGNGSGYLISLMAASRTANLSWTDADGDSGNVEDATGVSLEYIPIYDIDRDIWFKQRTTFVGWDQKPEPRTRFCSALFHNAINNTFELWMHGGQRLTDQAEGVMEIYVLSMPSFTWTQVNTAFPSNNLIRSHTCHAVGGQLIIVGGYPPGIVVESNVTCDSDYIKVLAIEEEDINWTPTYRKNSAYRTPLSISNVVRGNRVPLYGFVNEEFGNDFEPQCPGGPSCPGTSGGLSVAAIAGCVIAGIAVILATGWLLWYCRKRHRPAGTRNNSQNTEPIPRSPSNGQPEVVKTGNALPASHQRTTSQVTELHRADAELPAFPPTAVQTQQTV